ncbi:MAG: sulfotransferase family 2 domain-containing protein [Stellaceae bacterium]
MLFSPSPIDLDRQVIVFVHIPKTAGTSLRDVFVAHYGADRCVETRMEKFDKIHEGSASRVLWSAGHAFRNGLRRLAGRDPLLPRSLKSWALDRAVLLSGHFALGREPRLRRAPVYITLLRDPVERFISHYYFLRDLREQDPTGRRDSQPARKYDLDGYVNLLAARRLRGVTNVQCRYIAGVESFERARQTITDRVFLAAPSERLDDFLELLGRALGLRHMSAGQANVGRARQAAASPSAQTLAAIRHLVAEDEKLFDHVSRSFDRTYQAFAASSARARA